jgi:TM2 domain-containing membrane protein YozV
LKKTFLIGAVAFFVAAPFLFGQTANLNVSGLSVPALSFNAKQLFDSDYYSGSFFNRSLFRGKGDLKSRGESNLFLFPDSIKTDSVFSSSKNDSTLSVVKKKDKPFKMKKSPLVATLLSAVIPGAGQFYNRSYWKVPVIAGLVGYFGYEYFHYNNIYKGYRDQYVASQLQFPPEGDDNLKTLREFNRTQRDDFVWYFLIIYIINLADAYVDAHLFDFDVTEEKISTLGLIDRKASLKLHINF